MTSIRYLIHRGYIQNMYQKSKSLHNLKTQTQHLRNFSTPVPKTIPKVDPIPEENKDEPLNCDECRRKCKRLGDCDTKCIRCKKCYFVYICDECRLKFYVCENCKKEAFFIGSKPESIESVETMVKFISNKLSNFFKI